MRNFLIVLCLVFVLAFTSGFLISHFTTQSSKANNGGDVSQDCGHDAQIQALMREIEIRQDRIKDLEQRISFYHEAIVEMLRQFDIQFDWINELLGLINDATAEINDLEKQIADLQKQIDTYIQVDYYSDLGRTKNFVTPIDIVGTDNEVFIWEHFDTLIFLNMELWEWGDPFFGPTLVGYYVAFEFTVYTSTGTFEYVIEITHNAGANPVAKIYKNGVQQLQSQEEVQLFSITLTPASFSYSFIPTEEAEITAMYLNSLTFFHLPPVSQGGDA